MWCKLVEFSIDNTAEIKKKEQERDRKEKNQRQNWNLQSFHNDWFIIICIDFALRFWYIELLNPKEDFIGFQVKITLHIFELHTIITQD